MHDQFAVKHFPFSLALSELDIQRRCARLEDQLVWLLAVPEAEAGGEVAEKHRLLLDLGEEWLVDRLLVRCAVAGKLLLL